MYNGYYIELKFVTMLVRFSMVVHLSVNCKFAEIQSALRFFFSNVHVTGKHGINS